MYILLIIFINLFFYWRTLSYAGICDDIPVFNQAVEIPKGWWMYFWYHLHGRKYKSWKLCHWQNIIIHTINCILIYIAFGANNTSLIAALLFAINPVNNQGSIWISGKGYSLNTTWALVMWMFPMWSILIYIYGLYFSGASLIFFPLMFLFTNHWYLVFMIFLGFRREWCRIFNKKDPRSKFNTETNAELLTRKPRKVIIALKTYGYHFVNCITAFRLGYYHKYMFLHGVNAEENKKSYKLDKFFFIGLTLAVVTLVTRDFGLLWFSITIAMWCNVITFNQTITNRYLYLGNCGVMFTLTKLLMFYPPLALGLWVYYATLLYKFTPFYKNEYWSIEHSCWEQPEFFYPWQNRAVHCFQNFNYQGALANMLKANELKPKDWKVLYNICQIYLMLGNITLAKDFFTQAKLCKIDGREEVINTLMDRLEKWITEIEEQAKTSPQVSMDLGKFDMQR